jgi:hypothetical protein
VGAAGVAALGHTFFGKSKTYAYEGLEGLWDEAIAENKLMDDEVAARAENYSRDWGAAIEENNLKDEVYTLMKETNTEVGYFTGSGNLSVKQDLTHENIVGYRLSANGLRQIKYRLELAKCSYEKGTGPHVLSMHVPFDPF